MKTGTQRNDKELQEAPKGKNLEELNGGNRRNFIPPRGVRLFEQPKCAARPFGVQWRVDGKKAQKGFATKAARETFARSLVGDAKRNGVSAYRLDEDEARAWRAFRAEIGAASLADVAKLWNASGTRAAVVVAGAVTEFLAAKQAEQLSAAALSHYKKWLGRFSAAFGEREAATISRDEIGAWLKKLGLGSVTTRGHLTRVRGLFAWLVISGKLARNPCAGMKSPKVVAKEVGVYSVAQGAALFEENAKQPRELLGRLALEAFAGLRFSSATRICAAEIKFQEKGIVLPADKVKTERREFIDGLPDNLWAWLAWSKPETWCMTPRAYLEAKSNARVRADLPEVRNALRHSFCSYHIAAHKDPSRTSVILCHSSPRMLWRHYRGNATASDGAAWFQIVPPAGD